MLIEAEDFT